MDEPIDFGDSERGAGVEVRHIVPGVKLAGHVFADISSDVIVEEVIRSYKRSRITAWHAESGRMLDVVLPDYAVVECWGKL